MERHPPPMSPDTSRPSQFATQSVTCNFKRGIVCYATLALQMFEPGMVLNSDRKVMNFVSGLRGT